MNRLKVKKREKKEKKNRKKGEKRSGAQDELERGEGASASVDAEDA